MSAYLLDTNTLSELARPRPDPGVVRFLEGLGESYLSVLTVHELVYGLELLPARSAKRKKLTSFTEDMLSTFQEQILPVRQIEARIAALMRGQSRKDGRTLHVIDSILAATASANGLTLVTRNEKDMAHLQVEIVNPWARSR